LGTNCGTNRLECLCFQGQAPVLKSGAGPRNAHGAWSPSDSPKDIAKARAEVKRRPRYRQGDDVVVVRWMTEAEAGVTK